MSGQSESENREQRIAAFATYFGASTFSSSSAYWRAQFFCENQSDGRFGSPNGFSDLLTEYLRRGTDESLDCERMFRLPCNRTLPNAFSLDTLAWEFASFCKANSLLTNSDRRPTARRRRARASLGWTTCRSACEVANSWLMITMD